MGVRKNKLILYKMKRQTRRSSSGMIQASCIRAIWIFAKRVKINFFRTQEINQKLLTIGRIVKKKVSESCYDKQTLQFSLFISSILQVYR